MTDAGCECNRDGLELVEKKFLEMDCYLNVIGIDFEESPESTSDTSTSAVKTEPTHRRPNNDDDDNDVDDKSTIPKIVITPAAHTGGGGDGECSTTTRPVRSATKIAVKNSFYFDHF